jgi:hypothetical protein
MIYPMNFTCPACGFMGLEKMPWYQKTLVSGLVVWRTSHEICACHGIEFGRDDYAGGHLEKRVEVYERWQARWLKSAKQSIA